MKKKIYKITALLLATALMVMGCGSAKSGKENSDSTGGKKKIFLHRLRHPQIIAIQKKQKPLKLTG